jgi:hypothetical protein
MICRVYVQTTPQEEAAKKGGLLLSAGKLRIGSTPDSKLAQAGSLLSACLHKINPEPGAGSLVQFEFALKIF